MVVLQFVVKIFVFLQLVVHTFELILWRPRVASFTPLKSYASVLVRLCTASIKLISLKIDVLLHHVEEEFVWVSLIMVLPHSVRVIPAASTYAAAASTHAAFVAPTLCHSFVAPTLCHSFRLSRIILSRVRLLWCLADHSSWCSARSAVPLGQ